MVGVFWFCLVDGECVYLCVVGYGECYCVWFVGELCEDVGDGCVGGFGLY